MELQIDAEKLADPTLAVGTGIYVRAQAPNDKWMNVDISMLEKSSLFQFLRSRGGKNEWAENCIALMLGHTHFDFSIEQMEPADDTEIADWDQEL